VAGGMPAGATAVRLAATPRSMELPLAVRDLPPLHSLHSLLFPPHSHTYLHPCLQTITACTLTPTTRT
jgi:hypothetical protein